MTRKKGAAPPGRNPAGNDDASTRRTSRRQFLRSGLATTGAVATALYVKPAITSLSVPRAFASASPAPALLEPGASHLPVCIDFDEGLVQEGDVVTDQYLPYGFRVSTKNYWGFSNPHHPAVVFNSARPTGGDYDLGTPNLVFGGPGLGDGGGPGPGANQTPQDQVLIVQEGWTPAGATRVTRSDDYVAGGRLVFTFEAPVQVEEVHLLDVEAHLGFGSRVRTYNAPVGGPARFDAPIPDRGNNGFQVVRVDPDPNVRRLEIIFRSGGALVGFCYRR